MLTKDKAGQFRQDNSPESEISTKSTSESINGPKGLPLVGNLPEFILNPFQFLSKCRQKYGDIVKLYLPFLGATYLVSHPDYIEKVFVTRQTTFNRPQLYRTLAPFLGNGLALAEGETWLKNRRLLQPAFNRESIQTYLSIMTQLTSNLLADWQSQVGQPRVVADDMAQLTLEIVTKSLLDTEFGSETKEVARAFYEVMNDVNKHVFNPLHLPKVIPTPGNVRFRKATQRLEEVVAKIIAEHRTNPTHTDLLAKCMHHAHLPADKQMTDKQLRDEVMTLMLSGHESTATVLTWIWYLLATNLEVEAKLHAELDEVLAGRMPVADDLPRLVYTGSIIKEVLRLYPVLWFMGRSPTTNLELGEYIIPAGSTIMFSPWLLQHDSRFYSEPDVFRPERWLTGELKTLPKFAYFPFGGGSRQCIGSEFAFQELLLVVTLIAQQYKLRFPSEQLPTLKLTVGLTLKPPEALKLTLIPRTRLPSPCF